MEKDPRSQIKCIHLEVRHYDVLMYDDELYDSHLNCTQDVKTSAYPIVFKICFNRNHI